MFLSTINFHSSPDPMSFESQLLSSAVAVWGTMSRFIHLMVSPTFTVISAGVNCEFLISRIWVCCSPPLIARPVYKMKTTTAIIIAVVFKDSFFEIVMFNSLIQCSMNGPYVQHALHVIWRLPNPVQKVLLPLHFQY